MEWIKIEDRRETLEDMHWYIVWCWDGQMGGHERYLWDEKKENFVRESSIEKLPLIEVFNISHVLDVKKPNDLWKLQDE